MNWLNYLNILQNYISLKWEPARDNHLSECPFKLNEKKALNNKFKLVVKIFNRLCFSHAKNWTVQKNVYTLIFPSTIKLETH